MPFSASARWRATRTVPTSSTTSTLCADRRVAPAVLPGAGQRQLLHQDTRVNTTYVSDTGGRSDPPRRSIGTLAVVTIDPVRTESKLGINRDRQWPPTRSSATESTITSKGTAMITTHMHLIRSVIFATTLAAAGSAF